MRCFCWGLFYWVFITFLDTFLTFDIWLRFLIPANDFWLVIKTFRTLDSQELWHFKCNGNFEAFLCRIALTSVSWRFFPFNRVITCSYIFCVFLCWRFFPFNRVITCSYIFCVFLYCNLAVSRLQYSNRAIMHKVKINIPAS